MQTESQNQNIRYYHIVTTLRALLKSGAITKAEYERAKKYYANLTGASLIIAA